MNGIKQGVLRVLAIGIVLAAAVQAFGQATSFYSLQLTNNPPLPFNPFPALDTYPIATGKVAYDDRLVDYDLVRSFNSFTSSDIPALPGDDGGSDGGGGGGGFASPLFDTNGLWIELLQVTNSQAFLRLHNTTNGEMYQLQSKQILNWTNANPADWLYWVPGEIITATTNHIDYSPVDASLPALFFRAQHGDTTVWITRGANAIEPDASGMNAQTGTFALHRANPSNDFPVLAVYYRTSGSASNGADYNTLSGLTNFGSGDSYYGPVIDIVPIQDNIVEFEEDVVLTLIPTNTYLIDTSNALATITISDNDSNSVLQLVVTNLNHPVGMGYHPITNSLVVSYNWNDNGIPVNFARVLTNGVVTNWTSISGMPDEIKLTIAQTTTNGFTNGDMFFGNGTNGGIGWLSADGTRSNLNWISLTNTDPEETILRGGLYIDRTGVFSNDLIVVTGNLNSGPGAGGGVWRIDSHPNAVQLANIVNTHLEGVVTVPNDTNQYGPWAGKIITGAESMVPPTIFAIDTKGTVTSFALDIQPEDFHIIPTNQDFYVNDIDNNRILKLPRTLLTNYWGDLLITQAGEVDVSHPAKLFIVHWDTNTATFIKRAIPNPNDGDFEHGTFAPIDIPATAISNP